MLRNAISNKDRNKVNPHKKHKALFSHALIESQPCSVSHLSSSPASRSPRLLRRSLTLPTPDLSTLVTALNRWNLDLVDELSANGTLTVFAPTNDAFAALPTFAANGDGVTDSGVVGVFSSFWLGKHEREILLYHVFDDAAVLSSDLAETQEIEMANGEMLTVDRSALDVVTVTTTKEDTFTVTMADVTGSNGVVHIIDGVLVPSSIGATVIAIGAPYSTLLSLITLSGLDASLTSTGPWTLFAPNNAAFAKLATETVEFLQTEAGRAMLTEN
jgi:transforming growth factor-beta-induced protein